MRRRYMPSFKEQWMPIRTPEQFQIFYETVKDVASAAKIKMVPTVDGLDAFKEMYIMPSIGVAVEDKTITITGERRDIWPLAEFFESEMLGFTFFGESHTFTADSAKEVREKIADLKELTQLYGWGLDEQ